MFLINVFMLAVYSDVEHRPLYYLTEAYC